jgi:hypothetical protein
VSAAIVRPAAATVANVTISIAVLTAKLRIMPCFLALQIVDVGSVGAAANPDEFFAPELAIQACGSPLVLQFPHQIGPRRAAYWYRSPAGTARRIRQ